MAIERAFEFILIASTETHRLESPSLRNLNRTTLQGHLMIGNICNNPRIILIGPPCAGKTTVGEWLSPILKIPFLSMGNIYRENKHLLDPETVNKVDNGGLMSDTEVAQFLLPILAGYKQGWILDGVPRTIGQVAMLDGQFEMAFLFQVDDEEVFKRMRERMYHLRSGRSFSTFAPSKVPGLDDETGEPLARRPDDSEEAMGRRIKIFRSSIPEIEKALGGRLHRIGGSDSYINLDMILSTLKG
jgi:adenylate kinase family enzyme